MPVKVKTNLPAIEFLEKESIFVISDERASVQDIRPLKVAVLNLMPNKIATETQILRLISNTPIQVEVVFLRTASYQPTHTDENHLTAFYKTFSEVRQENQKFDGFIITGAPVEKMDFENVAYWDEFVEILEYAKHHVYSTMYICWAAQAAVYHLYNINKSLQKDKIFGLFNHTVQNAGNPLVRGFNDTFIAPHSRFTEIDREKMLNNDNLDVLAVSDEAGIYLASSKDLRHVFVFGHGEYDRDSLHNEYMRDLEKGLKPKKPKNYYVKNKVGSLPPIEWRASQSLLFANWINYCVYQNTPFDIESIK